MKAAVYYEFQGSIEIKEVPDPKCSDTGVVLKVEATGICRSDWHGWMGHDPDIVLPHVPGHEIAGTIVEVGNNINNWKIGDRVTLPFVCGCGVCPECQSGNHQVCDAQFQPGFTAWGSFAEFAAIDYADINLVRLPMKSTLLLLPAWGAGLLLRSGQWSIREKCRKVSGLQYMVVGELVCQQ